MGGGGSNTTVDSAMSDKQFKTLSNNQKNIAGSIDDGRSEATKRFNQVDKSLGGISTEIGGIGTNLSSGFTTLQDLMDQNMQANQQGSNNVSQNITDSTGQIQSGMQSGFADVNQNLTTGFGDMNQNFDQVGQRFDRVDAAQQDAQSAIDTGFQAQANAFTDLGTQVSDGFTGINETATQGFADVGQSLSDLDTNTQNRLDTVQNNVMTGQAILDQGIGRVADAQDVYYGDLSQRQQDIQQGQDEFQTNFDDYVQRYTQDTSLANQTRSDLQLGLERGVNRIRDQICTVAQAEEQRAAEQQGFMAQQFSDLVAQMAPETIVRNRDLARVASGDTNLDPGLRRNMFVVGQSFDNNGNLIMNSIDGTGNAVARNIDNAGNLNVRTFDPTGQVANQSSINLVETFDIINALQNPSALS